MRRLRGWFGTLRVCLLGPGEPMPPEGAPTALVTCLHPKKAITACNWQIGPYGNWGWFCRCRQCLAWFTC